MVHWLDQSDAGFEGEFQAFLSLKREASVDVDTAVAEIIDAVRKLALRPECTGACKSLD